MGDRRGDRVIPFPAAKAAHYPHIFAYELFVSFLAFRRFKMTLGEQPKDSNLHFPRVNRFGKRTIGIGKQMLSWIARGTMVFLGSMAEQL